MGKPEFQANVVVANEYTLIGEQSLFGVLTIGIVPVEIFVGQEVLLNRTTIYIQADSNNSDNIYLGFDNTVANNKYGICLVSGANTQIKVSSDDFIKIFAVSDTDGQKISVIEGKAN